MNVLALNHPKANAFISSGINISGIAYCHLCIWCMKAASVLVVQSRFASNEYLP
jgi:hypothetical protein